MTKKAAALLLAASLAVSVCAMPVFALTNSNGGSGDGTDNNAPTATEVTYKVDCSYTWSIPKNIDFGSNAGINAKPVVNANQAEDTASQKAEKTTPGTAPRVCVTENIIDVGKTLKISIDTTNTTTYESVDDKGFYVKAGEEKLYFTIIKPATTGVAEKKLIAGDSEVLSVPSGKYADEQNLVFTLSTATGDGAAEKAGTYNGSVAFKAELK